MKHPPTFAMIFPVYFRNQLIEAALKRNYRAIDQLTDSLAMAGYIRPRYDESRPWANQWGSHENRT